MPARPGVGRSLPALAVVVAVAYLIGGGAPVALAMLVDRESAAVTFSTAATFPNTTAPVVASSVISKTTPYLHGYIRQGGSYHVYANVTDSDGVATVTADVSGITAGQTAAALVAGSYSVGGVAYNYRSGSLTANAVLAEGTSPYSITASDTAGNRGTQSGFTVVIDNSRPVGSTVQTANAGSVIGRPELGDTISLTFSEIIEPHSVLAGWTGFPTSVVVRITNNAGGDVLTVRNAANSAQLPLGSVNLGGTGYVTANRDFGASATRSTMVQNGATVTITLGTPSGTATTQSAGTTMTWTTSAVVTDRAGNACLSTNVIESGTQDAEF